MNVVRDHPMVRYSEKHAYLYMHKRLNMCACRFALLSHDNVNLMS